MTGGAVTAAKAGVVGGGVIGGGWAARFLLHGWNVTVFDPDPDVQQQLQAVLDHARLALPALADTPMPAEGTLRFAKSLGEAVDGASWVQESVPEDLSLKHRVLAGIDSQATASAIIGSSTSGFRPGELQHITEGPVRILVAHPFNPVYILPLVEVVGGDALYRETLERACTVLTSIGMKPVVVRNEIDAHIADRLLESVWREALWLINDDIATTEEIDDVIRYGFGLRWAQMGLFDTYRLAGGEAGMAHFIQQFGPALQWPWSKLTDVPALTEALVQKIAAQSDAQSGHLSVRELERIRDRNLVGMLRSLKERNWGAGALLNEHDRRLAARLTGPAALDADSNGALRLLDICVLPGWIDYNGHMTEYRYTQVFSDASDRLLQMLGMDAEYVASGRSYYTAETHVMHLGEAAVDQALYASSQVLLADTKRLHVFYRLCTAEDDRLLATGESMYLHVDRASGRVCAASDKIVANAGALAAAHANLPRPATAGRRVGERKTE